MEKSESILRQLIEEQKALLLKIGRRYISHLTPDDLLQPNDFLELENSPEFRYEEGILAGLQSALAAILAKRAMISPQTLER